MKRLVYGFDTTSFYYLTQSFELKSSQSLIVCRNKLRALFFLVARC